MKNYRNIKVYLKIPLYLKDIIMSFIFGLYSRLNFTYDELSANIDTDKSISKFKLKSKII